MSTTIALHRLAENFLGLAREGARAGYAAKDVLRVRNAAERGWMGALQATDAAMARYGLIPEPGPRAESSRLEFLEAAGRPDLAKKLREFRDELHGNFYYRGKIPSDGEMAAALDGVAEYIRLVTEET